MTREYEVGADDDGTAAMRGIDRFVKECSHPRHILNVLNG